MDKLRLFLRKNPLHSYAWILAIPGTFLCGILTVTIASYVGAENGSFLHMLGEAITNTVLLIVLVPFCIGVGYVEAWYVYKASQRGTGRKVSA